MERIYQVLKTIFLYLSLLSTCLSPLCGGGDLKSCKLMLPGNRNRYVQIAAADEGLDIWQPRETYGGYRYGPSMILNRDGSLDVWSAASGPGDMTDLISHSRLTCGGRFHSRETIALKPTAGSSDQQWTCDPGAIKIGKYYYIGYTSTQDPRGVNNNVYVARSRRPNGPFLEKWDGNGWSDEPAPLIPYTDDPEGFGAGEPSFVLMGTKLYIYYSWNIPGANTTRVATADATKENWPATLKYHGTCIPAKTDGDSADVKYLDQYERFLAVFTEKRFSNDSYIAVWESFDGLRFRQSSFVKAKTAKRLHNCGISGRADGHIAAGDPVYLAYAYGTDWGNWPTRLHKVKLSLAKSPKRNPAAEQNVEIPQKRSKDRVISNIQTIKAEKQRYDIKQSEHIWTMALDSDGYYYPILFGVRFDGYDKSIIRIVGSRIFAVGNGVTRVRLHWHGYTGDFMVYAGSSANTK